MANKIDKKAFDFMSAIADRTGVEILDPERRTITTPAMIKAGIMSSMKGKSPLEGMNKYLDEQSLNQADYDWLKEKAKLIASDKSVAMDPFFGLTLGPITDQFPSSVNKSLFGGDIEGNWMKNLINEKPGVYRGQAWGLTGKAEEKWNKEFDLKKAPHLLDIYLGNTTPEKEGLNKIPGTESYDANSYVNFLGFVSRPENMRNLRRDVEQLNPGSKLSLNNYNVTPEIAESIDFGRKSWFVEKDKDGITYLSLNDKWDFEGMGAGGKLMKKAGGNVIDLQVRIPLNRDNFNYYGDWHIPKPL